MTPQDFEQIAPEMRQLMLGVGRDFFGNEMDAEDVAQEGLIALWRYCQRIEAGHPVRPLAIRIAKHCCIDLVRRQRATLDIDEQPERGFAPPGTRVHPSPQEEMEAHELQQALDDAVGRLNPSEQRLFRLRQIEGLTLDEISEQTHIAKPSVKSMITAARRKIFEAMKEHVHKD
ncbi:MAG: sigma-70 family RNA polymerase sigma factor [Bacteroidaceae bacterium]|nr:sigma-70 family RNA polymerase sigma factor [Bacteroidaceae bacterium]